MTRRTPAQRYVVVDIRCAYAFLSGLLLMIVFLSLSSFCVFTFRVTAVTFVLCSKITCLNVFFLSISLPADLSLQGSSVWCPVGQTHCRAFWDEIRRCKTRHEGRSFFIFSFFLACLYYVLWIQTIVSPLNKSDGSRTGLTIDWVGRRLYWAVNSPDHDSRIAMFDLAVMREATLTVRPSTVYCTQADPVSKYCLLFFYTDVIQSVNQSNKIHFNAICDKVIVEAPTKAGFPANATHATNLRIYATQ